jgi:hypothetical protein
MTAMSSARAVDAGGPDRPVGPAALQAHHARPVDLDDVGGEQLEVGQRRVPGAEVVDRDLDAVRLERGQVLRGAADVVDEHRLGHLKADLDVRGVQLRALQKAKRVTSSSAVASVDVASDR